MRHLHLACKSLSPDVSPSHLCLIKILMQERGELLVRHETQDFCISLGCWRGNHISSPSWAAQISIVLSVNNQQGKISKRGSCFWENTSCEVHSRLLRSFVNHTVVSVVSNPEEESIVHFQKVLLPQMQVSLSGIIKFFYFSNLKKKSSFSPLHPPHGPMAPACAVCSLYMWYAQPPTCSHFFFYLAS